MTAAARPRGHDRFERRISYEIGWTGKVYVDNFLEGYHLRARSSATLRLLDYRSYRDELAALVVAAVEPARRRAGPYRGEADAVALYWWLWPNTMLNVLPGPAADRCCCRSTRTLPRRLRLLLPARAGPADTVDDHAVRRRGAAEDSSICEAVKRGLASGSYEAGRLTRHARAGVALRRLLRAAMAGGGPA